MYKESPNPEQNFLPRDIDTEDFFSQLPLQSWPDQWHSSEHFPTPQSVGTDEFSRVINDAVSYDRGAIYRLGESHLPVAQFRRHFVETVAANQRVVVSSETGSGKSSQLGLFLIEAGHKRVFITQPRILAARELMERAQHNLGPDYQHLVGRLVGDASDSDCSPDARIIYVTEQLLFKMANRGALRPDDVIISDEAHERTPPTIVFMGKMKQILHDNPGMRFISSSATIDTPKYAKYWADPVTQEPAPVLILPGRTYPVTCVESGKSVEDTMKDYMAKGESVLAFQPGIHRMRQTQAKVRKSAINGGDVHLLYGDQSPKAQKAALNSNPNNHVIGNRIAETSITPEGKTVVVDSGMSNVGGYRAGVRILKTIFSTQDTMVQRRGRVGRTRKGEYALAIPSDAPPPPKMSERDEYEAPPIENTSVAPYIAELLANGERLEDLDLLEHPTEENLRYDHKLLRRLGAVAVLDDGELELTEVGKAIIDLPLDVQLARMLVEARKVFDGAETPDNNLRLQVAAAVAVQQVNGILDAGADSQQRYLARKSHQEKYSNENASDLLFELDVFTKLFAKQQTIMASGASDAEEQFERLLINTDIMPNRYYKAVRTYEELCRREVLNPIALQTASKVQRKQIVACQIVGAEELFVQKSKLTHRDIRGDSRSVGRRSNIRIGELLVGTAFDLEGMRETGVFRRRYITGASAITTDQLLEHAPQRITRKSVGYGVTRSGTFVERQSLYFDETLQFDEVESEISASLESRTALLAAMMTGTARSVDNPNHVMEFKPGLPNADKAAKQYAQALELDHRSRVSLRVGERYQAFIAKIVRDSVEKVPLDVTDPAELDQLIPSVYVSSLVRPSKVKDIPEIVRTSPDAFVVHADETTKRYIPIGYRNGIAYITVPRDLKYGVKPEDFAELQKHHNVKLRVGAGEYQYLEVFFAHVEEQRLSPQRQKRLQRREEIAAAAQSGERVTTATHERHADLSIHDTRDAALRVKAVPQSFRNTRRVHRKPRESKD